MTTFPARTLSTFSHVAGGRPLAYASLEPQHLPRGKACHPIPVRKLFSLGLALRVALCHAQREGGGGRTATRGTCKAYALQVSCSCANVNARQSVVIVRKDCYQSNRASCKNHLAIVTRSERYHEFCPACLFGLCERSLRTVIAVGTSPTAQREELHPPRIWIILCQRLARHPLTVIPWGISPYGYFFRWLRRSAPAPLWEVFPIGVCTPKKPLASVATC